MKLGWPYARYDYTKSSLHNVRIYTTICMYKSTWLSGVETSLHDWQWPSPRQIRLVQTSGRWKSVLLWVTGKSRGRAAHGRKFAVGSTQRWGRVVGVFVHRAAPGIHKEVDDGGHFQTQLFGNRRLDLLAWTLDLAEDGHQGAPLDLGEHHPGLLGCYSRARLRARRRSTRYIITPLSTCTRNHRQITATAVTFPAHFRQTYIPQSCAVHINKADIQWSEM